MSNVMKDQERRQSEMRWEPAAEETPNIPMGAEIRKWAFPVLGVVFLAGWFLLDTFQGGVYRAQILPSCLILGCVLFLKVMDLLQADR